MMVMDTYYNITQQQLQQYSPSMLWNKINSLHLSYLAMEESPEKIKHKTKLEECIHHYLCEAHHNQKFECTSTPKVLHESAAKMPDFSGYKAALGWDAIGRYAANLLTKPWRREFRQIKMYSGFYKHEVESNLIGAEAMFVEMGYKQQTDNQHLVLTGPVCPDRLASVSLDSIMAYVECQILKEIWEEVSQVYNVSWLDVLSLRELYAGSPQETINGMIHMKKVPSVKVTHPSYAPPPRQPQLYYYGPPGVSAPSQTCCGNFCMHNAPYTAYYYPSQSQPLPPPIPPPPPLQMRLPVAAACAHHAASVASVVPTARLIEYDSGCDQPDARVHDAQTHLAQLYLSEPPAKTTSSERDDGSGTYESWDYVYRNLESQGYSKDLGERGDVLLQTNGGSHVRPKAKRSETTVRRESKPFSTYDNVSDKPSKAKVAVEAPSPTTATSVVNATTAKGWHCSTCTFLNPNEKDICAMCSKSRKKPMDEHLQVGGTQCEKCTYVNDKAQKTCSMCGYSLNKSPTYI